MEKYRMKIVWEKINEDLPLSSYIDHTNLSPTATPEDIHKLCQEAIQYNFASVCVHPCYVQLCKKLLSKSLVLVCTVVGFPLGQNHKLTKIYETVLASNDGADEIDMVANISDIKARNTRKIIDEINDIVKASKNGIVKVIVETSLLTHEDKEYIVKVISASKAKFIKTSTGFSTSGANIEDIKMWKKWIDSACSDLEIKASGGIRDFHTFMNFIEAGATRIGTSSGVKIMTNQNRDSSNEQSSNITKNSSHQVISLLKSNEVEPKSKKLLSPKKEEIKSETKVEIKEKDTKLKTKEEDKKKHPKPETKTETKLESKDNHQKKVEIKQNEKKANPKEKVTNISKEASATPNNKK